MIILSDTQNKAANGIIECFVNNQKIVKLAGFAGTGKTTIIRDIIQKYKSIKNLKSIAYVTFTGKASTVLNSKISDIMDKQDFCGTIHSLIYKPVFKKDILTGKSIISKWVRADSLPYELIVVDESSMLPNDILNDLKTYNIPMLLVGDHGQLPPVSENQESVLINPDFVLTEIHRQCENNPIIKLSQYVRNMGILPNSAIWSKEVFKLSWNHDKCKELFYNINFNNNDLIVLCAFNKTRVKINNIIR
jgi:exodeoxyribonuclease-5